MQRLQTAGHAVKTATEHLVNAARQSVTEDERTLVISDRMVTGIAQVRRPSKRDLLIDPFR